MSFELLDGRAVPVPFALTLTRIRTRIVTSKAESTRALCDDPNFWPTIALTSQSYLTLIDTHLIQQRTDWVGIIG